jgi:hypothetical protein
MALTAAHRPGGKGRPALAPVQLSRQFFLTGAVLALFDAILLESGGENEHLWPAPTSRFQLACGHP